MLGCKALRWGAPLLGAWALSSGALADPGDCSVAELLRYEVAEAELRAAETEAEFARTRQRGVLASLGVARGTQDLYCGDVVTADEARCAEARAEIDGLLEELRVASDEVEAAQAKVGAAFEEYRGTKICTGASGSGTWPAPASEEEPSLPIEEAVGDLPPGAGCGGWPYLPEDEVRGEGCEGAGEEDAELPPAASSGEAAAVAAGDTLGALAYQVQAELCAGTEGEALDACLAANPVWGSEADAGGRSIVDALVRLNGGEDRGMPLVPGEPINLDGACVQAALAGGELPCECLAFAAEEEVRDECVTCDLRAEREAAGRDTGALDEVLAADCESCGGAVALPAACTDPSFPEPQ